VCILDNGDTVTVEHGVRHRLVDTTESIEFVDDQAADSPLFQDILGIGLDECAPKFLSGYRLARQWRNAGVDANCVVAVGVSSSTCRT